MERRVPPAERETPPGVTLTPSTMGGYSVHRADSYLGYIHATGPRDQYRAYVRRIGQDDQLLGVMPHTEAVAAVVAAWDARLPTLNQGRTGPPPARRAGTAAHGSAASR